MMAKTPSRTAEGYLQMPQPAPPSPVGEGLGGEGMGERAFP